MGWLRLAVRASVLIRLGMFADHLEIVAARSVGAVPKCQTDECSHERERPTKNTGTRAD
jgi:hypothetical protein